MTYIHTYVLSGMSIYTHIILNGGLGLCYACVRLTVHSTERYSTYRHQKKEPTHYYCMLDVMQLAPSYLVIL